MHCGVGGWVMQGDSHFWVLLLFGVVGGGRERD